MKAAVAFLEEEVSPISKLVGEAGADDPPGQPCSSLDPSDDERDAPV
jgi:hypothetical protein